MEVWSRLLLLEQIINTWSLTLSVAKTKLLVTGSTSDDERLPIKLGSV